MTERKANAQTYKRIFEGNNDGADILEDLVKRFSREYKMHVEVDGMTNSMMMAEAAGKRAVIDFILSQVNQANGVEQGEQDE